MYGIRFNATPGQFVLPQGIDTTRAFDDPSCVTRYVADKLTCAEQERSMQALREEEEELQR